MENDDNFGHMHPVVFKEIERSKRDYECNACKLSISTSLAYCCDKCDYFNIHSTCAELPREMRHPLHPEHTLTLVFNQPNGIGRFDCHVCGSVRWGFSFHCSVCEIDIDLHCADLEPQKGSSSNNQTLITHPHPLIICDYKINSDFNATINCTYCKQPIVKGKIKGKGKGRSSIFVCLECPLLLDESCARLPLEIQHPFHQSHSLALDRVEGYCYCGACEEFVFGFTYNCSQCDFNLDVRCASLMPITNDIKDNEHYSVIATTTTHCHPYIICQKTNNSFSFSCSGCLQTLKKEDSIYVCLDCRQILHESCSRLPRRMLEHPYHPKHPLSLVDFPKKSRYKCAACCQTREAYDPPGFIYKCGDCDTTLHTTCALPVAPLINSQLHLQHPLAFLDIQVSSLKCNACGDFCHYSVFRCVECNFTLHAHCLSDLPPTFKSTRHLHPLTLTNQPIKDYEDEDDDSEFLCDACEKERILCDPTYYCSECYYVAHVHCVISEILPSLQRDSTSLGNKLGNMKLEYFTVDVIEDSESDEETAQIDPTVFAELDSQIAAVQTELDQLNIEREAITRQLETKTTKLDQLNKSGA